MKTMTRLWKTLSSFTERIILKFKDAYYKHNPGKNPYPNVFGHQMNATEFHEFQNKLWAHYIREPGKSMLPHVSLGNPPDQTFNWRTATSTKDVTGMKPDMIFIDEITPMSEEDWDKAKLLTALLKQKRDEQGRT